MSTTITYADKTAIAPVGVSQVRTFGGPVNLKIVASGTAEAMSVTDNFPSGLTARNLFGATIVYKDVDNVEKSFIADGVYTDSNNDVYFSLGTTAFYYDFSEGRAKFVTE